jgi:hypothetical protein
VAVEEQLVKAQVCDSPGGFLHRYEVFECRASGGHGHSLPLYNGHGFIGTGPNNFAQSLLHKPSDQGLCIPWKKLKQGTFQVG